MSKKIVRNEEFLKIPSEMCTAKDLFIVKELKETLAANKDKCVGMAANMIGYSKRMIIVNTGFTNLIMINPVIISRYNKYKTEEGCLSLTGLRPCVRYEEIEVEYEDETFKKHRQIFKGYTAQIIQHECDHLEGIII